jgi:hypothetical protein
MNIVKMQALLDSALKDGTIDADELKAVHAAANKKDPNDVDFLYVINDLYKDRFDAGAQQVASDFRFDGVFPRNTKALYRAVKATRAALADGQISFSEAMSLHLSWNDSPESEFDRAIFTLHVDVPGTDPDVVHYFKVSLGIRLRDPAAEMAAARADHRITADEIKSIGQGVDIDTFQFGSNYAGDKEMLLRTYREANPELTPDGLLALRALLGISSSSIDPDQIAYAPLRAGVRKLAQTNHIDLGAVLDLIALTTMPQNGVATDAVLSLKVLANAYFDRFDPVALAVLDNFIATAAPGGSPDQFTLAPQFLDPDLADTQHRQRLQIMGNDPALAQILAGISEGGPSLVHRDRFTQPTWFANKHSSGYELDLRKTDDGRFRVAISYEGPIVQAGDFAGPDGILGVRVPQPVTEAELRAGVIPTLEDDKR